MNLGGERLYAVDGVDVAKEASFSSLAGQVCKESYQNSPFVEVNDLSSGHFRGPRPFSFKNLPAGCITEVSADGVGTKSILSDAADMHETIAQDLIAMVATDITRYGGLPLVLVNILDLTTVPDVLDGTHAYEKLLRGLGEVARASNTVVLKGETAQMSVCIGSEIPASRTSFNWGATMTGVYHPDKMVTGTSLQAGQKVIALKENGFRCNGISSVRKALALQYGETWWNNEAAKHDVRAAATPSVLYDLFVNTLHGWYADDFKPEITLHSITHLSGGGVVEKFARDTVLERGLSAELYALHEPPEIMKKCAAWRGMSDEEFYEAWNGGQGMLLVVDESEAKRCVERAADFGITAQVCGEITAQETPSVTIHSKVSNQIITVT